MLDSLKEGFYYKIFHSFREKSHHRHWTFLKEFLISLPGHCSFPWNTDREILTFYYKKSSSLKHTRNTKVGYTPVIFLYK
jgi:hypothetical protein